MYLILSCSTFDFIVCGILGLSFVSLFMYYIQMNKTRIETYVEKIPGLFRLPIVGTAYILLFVKRGDFFKYMIKRFKTYPIFRSWMGNNPNVNLSRAEHAEVVLNNSIQIEKSAAYNYIKPWLGEGLLISSGKRWQCHRKLLTPAFHFKILDNSLKTFELKAKVLIKQLKKVREGDIFDMYPYITRIALDIICETAMGIQLDSVNTQNYREYVEAIYTITDISLQRILKPWLQPDFIFKYTNRGKRFGRSLRVLHDFTTKVIKERRSILSHSNNSAIKDDDDNADDDGYGNDKQIHSKRSTFLDILLETSNTVATFSEEDVRQEVDTFLFEGHDTITAALSWCLFLLGNHLDIQDKVYEEITKAFENHKGPVDMEVLGKLKLLDRCIKESLRLYPSVPIVARQLQKDIDIGGYLVPAGCTVNLHIYAIHRDPRYYHDPEKFDPDRFLPENNRRRPAYSYIPFSAGPRNCIGQKYAMLEEKTLLAYILKNFKVRAVETERTARPSIGLILKPLNSLLVSFHLRK